MKTLKYNLITIFISLMIIQPSFGMSDLDTLVGSVEVKVDLQEIIFDDEMQKVKFDILLHNKTELDLEFHQRVDIDPFVVRLKDLKGNDFTQFSHTELIKTRQQKGESIVLAAKSIRRQSVELDLKDIMSKHPMDASELTDLVIWVSYPIVRYIDDVSAVDMLHSEKMVMKFIKTKNCNPTMEKKESWFKRLFN